MNRLSYNKYAASFLVVMAVVASGSLFSPPAFAGTCMTEDLLMVYDEVPETPKKTVKKAPAKTKVVAKHANTTQKNKHESVAQSNEKPHELDVNGTHISHAGTSNQ